MIFQEPLSCLNPVLSIDTQIIEAIPSMALSRSAAQTEYPALEQVQLLVHNRIVSTSELSVVATLALPWHRTPPGAYWA